MKRYSQKRQMIDYNNLISLTGQSRLLCIDEAVWQVARVLLSERGLWKSTYYKVLGQDGYETITDQELSIIENLIAETLGGDMSCEEIVTELSGLRASLSNLSGGGGCGCGSGGAGSTDETDPGIDTGQPGSQTGPPPPGFVDWPTYNTYKCDVATLIVQNQLSDVNRWATTNWVGMTLTAFVAALLTPIPGDEVVVLLAALVGLALGGFASVIITHMQNLIGSNFDDLVCALYDTTDSSSALSNYETQIDTIVDAALLSAFDSYNVKWIWKMMVSQTAMNDLFEHNPNLGQLPTGDCSGCQTCVPGMLVGTGDFNTLSFSSAPVSDHHELGFWLGLQATYSLQLAGWSFFNHASINDFRISDWREIGCEGFSFPGWNEYDSDTPPPGSYNVGRVFILSNTPFTLQLT